MSAEEWIKKYSIRETTEWINNIQYRFCIMRDGWIAIFQITDSGLIPRTQAKDMKHAITYCSLIEPTSFPMTRIGGGI